VTVFPEVDSAVWLPPVLTVRFLMGSHTSKGLCPISNRKHKIAQPEDNWLFPQQGASFSEYGVSVCVPITIIILVHKYIFKDVNRKLLNTHTGT
jgi:hypothetical protein